MSLKYALKIHLEDSHQVVFSPVSRAPKMHHSLVDMPAHVIYSKYSLQLCIVLGMLWLLSKISSRREVLFLSCSVEVLFLYVPSSSAGNHIGVGSNQRISPNYGFGGKNRLDTLPGTVALKERLFHSFRCTRVSKDKVSLGKQMDVENIKATKQVILVLMSDPDLSICFLSTTTTVGTLGQHRMDPG